MKNLKQQRLSVIIPCYQEAENISPLCERLASIAPEFSVFEVILVDDDSGDDTQVIVASLQAQYPWLKLKVRKANRSLSLSVIEGFNQALGDILLCMDADLSHPPEKIPALVEVLERADMVLGSRYVHSAKIDEQWSGLRHINAWVAKQLGRCLVRINDPLSGFFALRQSDYAAVKNTLSPIGYKIGLELMVKLKKPKIVEVPIEFGNRLHGKSKLSFREILKFFTHFLKLVMFKFGPR
ncbi:MAG: hypothetical protein COV52_05490 [Gammaproteobacteria bacterium CG11_big_fil_rev_8_21_14_0_20_46_22]|nr:MAG: hypothetical protein COW05_08170 [Gammaproteobacteria bacterium CG12_big_fil_rev_8_21_14_0_65_46_12]PIR10958.1 MAG: hypothetical protein COV52_05490 [Gammaproteobacteria bacterium CG11_big_fil_rev_8_21_14_0_20_46_22]